MSEFAHFRVKNLLVFVLVSLFLHFLLIMILLPLEKYYINLHHNLKGNSSPKNQRITLVKLNKTIPLEKLRTFGKNNGVKNIFTVPLKPKANIVGKQQIEITEAKGLTKSKTDIFKNKNRYQIKKKIHEDLNSAFLLKRENTDTTTTTTMSTYPANTFIPGPSITEDSSLPTLPDNVNLNIQFEFAQGVDLDQLNLFELKFYSFRLRVFKSYISAIFDSYRQFQLENPQLNLSRVKKQSMIATVTYNIGGGIEQVSFIRSADDDKIQEFFQRALERNNVRNPPKEMVQNNFFQLSYELVINP